jgi:hypothetical protein
MTNRREFLQAAAISALPASAGAAPVAASLRASATTRTALHTVLVDERHEETRTFAARMASRGASVHGVPEGDVTAIWLREIRPAWKRYPMPVAGLTGRPALFCLEQLALAGGLRVVFHAEHIVHSGGETEHSVLRGGAAAQLSARDLMRAGPVWPALLANAMSDHRELADRVRPGPSNAAFAPTMPPGAQLLTSWIIARV